MRFDNPLPGRFWQILLVVILIAVLTAVIRLVELQKNAQTNRTPQPAFPAKMTSPTPSDLPLLYPGIKWKATKSGTLDLTSSNASSVSIPSQVNEISSLRSLPIEVIDYYNRESRTRGWDQIEAASGPHGDEVDCYKTLAGHYLCVEVRFISPDSFLVRVEHT